MTRFRDQNRREQKGTRMERGENTGDRTRTREEWGTKLAEKQCKQGRG